MADIKQAATWLLKGRAVQRHSGRFWLSPDQPEEFWFCYEIVCADGGRHQLDAYDLLADDWELAD